MGAEIEGTSNTMTVADLFRMGNPPYPSVGGIDGLSAPIPSKTVGRRNEYDHVLLFIAETIRHQLHFQG
jgi:hypothetical protein